MAKSAAQLLMERETRVCFGPVPHSLLGDPLPETSWHMLDDSFLLRGEGNQYFHYRMGKGITVERDASCDIREESLWLNGSVYAAVASMNGLVPIHASAVAHQGKVYAFSGPAGAGKSTLIAALGSRGLPMFCDDTLVLDLSDPDRIICLPGHKRLKLTADAIKLTGAAREEKVSPTIEKYFARSGGGDVEVALPLAELIFLEEGAEPAMIPIPGPERLVRGQDDHHTAHLFAAAQRFDRAQQFAHLVRLARQIRMTRFQRPLDRSRFDEGIALAAQHVTNGRI